MRPTFIGAAQEVTGSCLLVETDDVRFLVDCGMFQGGREAHERNVKAWPFDPRQIHFVLLTHAHIDHSGLLPRLCALGFRGPVITTRASSRHATPCRCQRPAESVGLAAARLPESRFAAG